MNQKIYYFRHGLKALLTADTYFVCVLGGGFFGGILYIISGSEVLAGVITGLTVFGYLFWLVLKPPQPYVTLDDKIIKIGKRWFGIQGEVNSVHRGAIGSLTLTQGEYHGGTVPGLYYLYLNLRNGQRIQIAKEFFHEPEEFDELCSILSKEIPIR